MLLVALGTPESLTKPVSPFVNKGIKPACEGFVEMVLREGWFW